MRRDGSAELIRGALGGLRGKRRDRSGTLRVGTEINQRIGGIGTDVAKRSLRLLPAAYFCSAGEGTGDEGGAERARERLGNPIPAAAAARQ